MKWNNLMTSFLLSVFSEKRFIKPVYIYRPKCEMNGKSDIINHYNHIDI